MKTMLPRLHILAIGLFGLLGLISLAAPAQGSDPWAALDAVREDLATSGPTQAAFRQSYVPAGFSTGESESGRMALDLPRCLRWDYLEPYAKSYLLCDNVAWAWAEDDPAGQRQELDPSREPGLDLLLLATDDLRLRYRADSYLESTAEDADSEPRLRIELTPLAPTTQLASATLVIDPQAHRLRRLQTMDAEGNRTTFEIEAYRPLEEGVDFSPPENLEWQTP